jgi:hypothetical protein
MAKYTYAQLKQLWIQNGGNPAAADIAAAVALAESGGDSSATNTNTDGSTDRGLWQINSVHGALSTFDVTGNVKAAIQVSNNGANWSPWVTYVSGAFRKFLSPTTAASTGTLPANTTSASGIGLPGVGGISVSGLVTSGINALLGMLGLGSLKDMVERAGLIILGFALVILGIHLLANGGSSPVTSSSNESAVSDEAGNVTYKRDTNRKISSPVGSHTRRTSRTSKITGTSEAVEAAAIA